MAGKVVVFDQPEAEISRAAASTAMASPTQLKNWLNASGRRYIVFVADDVIDALPWPGGVEALTQVTECYRQHRAVEIAEEKPCSKCGGQPPKLGKRIGENSCGGCNGAGIERRYKTDVLEPDEMKHAVEYLIGQIRKTDPNWSP